MADEQQSTVKSSRPSSRKKRTPMTQEVDGGFRYTRKSRRLRKKSPDTANDEVIGSTRNSKRKRKIVEDKTTDVKSKQNVEETLTVVVEELSNRKDNTATTEHTATEIEGVTAMSDNENENKQCTNDDENSEKQKTKPKRRRSFFQRGRKPQSSLEIHESETLTSVKDLLKEIPTNLSSDKRLLLLIEKSLQLMSERLDDENIDGIPDFSEQAKDIITSMQESLKHASWLKVSSQQEENQTRRILLPNPKNAQLEKFVKESTETTKRMLVEDKKWEDLLYKYQEKSISCERTNEGNLLPEQEAFFKESLPLDKMRESLSKIKSKAEIAIDKVCETTDRLAVFDTLAKEFIDKNTKSLGTKAFEGVSGTPRKLVKGALTHFK